MSERPTADYDALVERLEHIVRECAEPHYDANGYRNGDAVPVTFLLDLIRVNPPDE
jgi:hypothetical protein